MATASAANRAQFGLNKLPATLKKVIGSVPKKIENALRKGLRGFAKTANGWTAVKEKNSSLTTNKNSSGQAIDVFSYGGKEYRLVVSAESMGGRSSRSPTRPPASWSANR